MERYVSTNKQFGGYNIGILVMKSWVPKLPGHISCASNYDFPVYYYVVDDSNVNIIHSGDKVIIPKIMEGIEYLKNIGCKAVMSSCGYFAHFQKEISEKSDIPVFLSSICLIPFLLRLHKDKLLVLCYNKEKLTDNLFDACGVTEKMRERIVIADVINENELGNIIKNQGHYNILKAKNEIVNISNQMCRKNDNISAILIECTDLPPHAYAIQEETNLPVYDPVSMVKFVNCIMENN